MTKRSNVLSLIFIAFLSLITVFTLTACGKTKAPQTQGPTETTAVVTTTAGRPEIRVSYDQNFVFDSESIENISDAVKVEIVVNGVSQRVDYTVKGYEVSDDGQFVDITIQAYGMEQTIRVPYLELIDPIRAELKPLYDLLNEEGNKSLTASVSGNNGDEDLFSYNLVANFKETGEIEFAVVDSENNVLALLANNMLTIGTLSMELDMEAISAFIIDLMGSYEDEEEMNISLESDFDMEEDSFDLTEIFTTLSSVLDALDSFVGSPMLSAFNVSIEKENDTYKVKINSQTLLMLLPMLIDEEETDINLDEIINTIDTLMDGALKSGEFELELSFSIKDTAVALSVKGNNKVTESTFTLNLNAALSNTLATLPTLSEEQAEPKDLELAILLSFPGKEFDATLFAFIHTSDMFSELDGEIAHLLLVDNNTSDLLANFVLDNHFAYLDMSGLNAKLELNEESETLSFYQAFEIDGEEVSFVEYMQYLIESSEDSDDEMDDEGNDTFVEDSRFKNGYGARFIDNDLAQFNIGITEEELRNSLFVFYFDENDNEVEYKDYTFINFDSSKSFVGDLEIQLAEGYVIDEEIYIVDVDNVRASGLSSSLDTIVVPKGITVEDLELFNLCGSMKYTDGNVNWYVEVSGFKATKLLSMTGTETNVDSESVLNEAGDYVLAATYEGYDSPFSFLIHVYDPENLVTTGIDCYNTYLYVYDNTTLDDLREQLDVVLIYDNEDRESIEDYEIIGFADDARYITIKYNDFQTRVAIERYDSYDDEESNGFDFKALLPYLRFVEFDEESEMSEVIQSALDAICAIVEEHKEEFDALYTVEVSESGIILTFNINNTDDTDLFSVINYFLGVPTETGYVDIDEEYVLSLIDEFKENTEYGSYLSIVETILGFSVSNIVEDSYVTFAIYTEEGVFVTFSLDNSDSSYMSLGFGMMVIDPADDVNVTPDMVEAAQGFDVLPGYLLALLFRAMM